MGITTIFRRGVSLVLLLLLVAGLSGCRSSRSVTVTEAVERAEQRMETGDWQHAEKTAAWQRALAACDSLNIVLTADSIRTPEGGVVYNPVVNVSVASPTMERESVVHQEVTDTIHTENRESSTEQIDRETTDDRKTVAVAEPPTLKIILGIIGILILMLIGKYLLKIKKKNANYNN